MLTYSLVDQWWILATLQGDCLHINCFESYSQNNPVVVTYQNNLRRSRRFSWCRNKMLQFNYNIMLISWLLRIFCSRLLRQSSWTTQMLLNVKVGLCFDHLSFVILLVTLVTLINVLTWNSAQMRFFGALNDAEIEEKVWKKKFLNFSFWFFFPFFAVLKVWCPERKMYGFWTVWIL